MEKEMGRHHTDGSRDPAVERRASGQVKPLQRYDATHLVGLRTYVYDAAIDGEVMIELPRQRELMASAAVARCLMPIRLRGWEIKALRKAMRSTAAEFAKKLGEKTAA